MKNNSFRALTTNEVEQLQQYGNRADDWKTVLVNDIFDASLIRNNTFMGQVRLGALGQGCLHDGDLHLPEGIYNSMLYNATVGDHCAIHNVRMLGGYTVGNGCLLFNIDEMTASAPNVENDYPWIEPMNENGGRRILPFSGMTIGEAYMWARYRGHKAFTEKLEQYTYDIMPSSGTVGDHCVIAAHSFVNKDIPAYSIAAGIPAKVIGRVAVREDGQVEFEYDSAKDEGKTGKEA